MSSVDSPYVVGKHDLSGDVTSEKGLCATELARKRDLSGDVTNEKSLQSTNVAQNRDLSGNAIQQHKSSAV